MPDDMGRGLPGLVIYVLARPTGVAPNRVGVSGALPDQCRSGVQTSRIGVVESAVCVPDRGPEWQPLCLMADLLRSAPWV